MKGEFEYRFRYFGRTGARDLFGFAPLQDNGADGFIGFAGPNCYRRGASVPEAEANAPSAGVRITRGGFSRFGSDAQVTDMRLTLHPSIIINRAAAIYATLNFGGFRHKYAMGRYDGRVLPYLEPWAPYNGNAALYELSPGVPPFERYYMSQTSDAATNTASIISVEQFKAVFHTPIAVISVGTKDFPIGVGATWAKNTREESVYMVVPYGPINWHFYFFPGEPPRGGGFSERLLGGWGVSPDGTLKNQHNIALLLTYHAGSIELGGGFRHRNAHLCPGAFYPSVAIGGTLSLGLDEAQLTGIGWMKWDNGVWFANVEYAFDNLDNRWQNIPPSAALAPLTFIERYHCFAEAGRRLGPARATLLWAQSSGPVFGANPAELLATPPNRTKYYRSFPINYQAMEPYNYLMFHTYAGGSGHFNNDGTGEMGDAVAFAARLDYAVASNLNLSFSYLWASRLEIHSFYAGDFGTIARRGAIEGDPLLIDGGTLGSGSFPYPAEAARDFKALNGFSGANPYVNDRFLGWELNAGLDWQLLEGVTLRMLYAYWKPGQWFDLAYKAFTPSASGLVGNGIMVGRDSIQAFQTSIFLNF